MPKRTDISKVMVIGAGPIIIGQACEFDYSGTQALKALKEEGCQTVLVNSNPATIMTDPFYSDETFIEPLTIESLEKIIKKTRPDSLLPTMGGQTALNCALELHKKGILKKYNVEMLGVKPESIEKAEDRNLFKKAMKKLHLDVSFSQIVTSVEEAEKWLEEKKLPAIIRPSFTLGGRGGGIARTQKEFFHIIKQGLALSPIHEVLIDESLLGWKEFEMEVVNDKNNNGIIVCSIENIDPMGIHTGDSITVAPALTLTDKQYQVLRTTSLRILEEIGVTTGGANVQFAIQPRTGRLIVVEMNPRVSRSSALASKATGFPIAKVATKLALGYTLDEIQNDITKVTPASFEPSIDYIVTKIPRFNFEKFYAEDHSYQLSTSMKSVGEVMSLGRSFLESLQKGFQSLETGLAGLNEVKLDLNQLRDFSPQRLLYVAQAFRENYSVKQVEELTKIDPWFLREIEKMVQEEAKIKAYGIPETKFELLELKKMGFCDERLAQLTHKSEKSIKELREKLEVKPVFRRVDTCASQFDTQTSYLYSCYEGDGIHIPLCESSVSENKKVIIIGSGPNRIGQGIEFDYACTHACLTLQKMGIESIMVNCNPETVSTDYDTSDKLYFEPLRLENILSLIEKEQQKGELLGVLLQCGGQTPLNLAPLLHEYKVPILGTNLDSIFMTEDRDQFRKLTQELKLKIPKSEICDDISQIPRLIENIGYPVLIRPSYVIGGEAMSLLKNPEDLKFYLHKNTSFFEKKLTLLIDKFLDNAIEVDVDAICDTQKVFIGGISEHVEPAGIHSGDSASSYPCFSLPDHIISEIKKQTKKIALHLKIKGFINIQFAVKNDEIFLIEVNPRASRSIPFLEKASGLPLCELAIKSMLGEKLSNSPYQEKQNFSYFSVKESQFSFEKFEQVDPVLGPEMKSLGEVMGIGSTFHEAYDKALISTKNNIPDNCSLFYMSSKAPADLIKKYKKVAPITHSEESFSKISFFVSCEKTQIDKKARQYAVGYGKPLMTTYKGAHHALLAYQKRDKNYDPRSLQELHSQDSLKQTSPSKQSQENISYQNIKFKKQIQDHLNLSSFFDFQIFSSPQVRLKLRDEIVSFLQKKPDFKESYEKEINSLLDIKNSPPQLSFMNLSTSHFEDTGGFVVARSDEKLGLDIEKKSRIQEKILARICKKEELALLDEKHFLWCAKEASFKSLYPLNKETSFSQVKISSWKKIEKNLFHYNFELLSFKGQGLAFETPELIGCISRLS